MTSFRKCHILKPKNSSHKPDSNPHSSIGGRLGEQMIKPLRYVSPQISPRYVANIRQAVYPVICLMHLYSLAPKLFSYLRCTPPNMHGIKHSYQQKKRCLSPVYHSFTNHSIATVQYMFPSLVVILQIEGYRPEWCISTIYNAWDTPFWSGTLEIMSVIWTHLLTIPPSLSPSPPLPPSTLSTKVPTSHYSHPWHRTLA